MAREANMRVIGDPWEEPLPLEDMYAVYKTFFVEQDGGEHMLWEKIAERLDGKLGTGDSLVARMHTAMEALRDVELVHTTPLEVGAGSLLLHAPTNNVRGAIQLVEEVRDARDS